MHMQSTTHTQSTAPIPTTALLVSSTNFNWVGLRGTLAGWPELRVIDDVQQHEPALRITTQEHPDLILLASDLATLRLVRDLHTASPSSRVVVLDQRLEPETYSQLDALGVAGFIQWKAVTPERIRLALATICEGQLYVGCKEAIHPIGCAPNRASTYNHHRGVARR